MARIIIFGDSFACANAASWCHMLATQHQITNHAQAGCSEYRIWQQWQKYHQSSWDHAIICHTSPNRIYCAENFFHEKTGSHKNADLIYQDVKSRQGNPQADHVVWWFEHVFDLQQAEFMHRLLIDHWTELTHGQNIHHISFFDITHPRVQNLYPIWQTCPGDINHLNQKGNELVVTHISGRLQKILHH